MLFLAITLATNLVCFDNGSTCVDPAQVVGVATNERSIVSTCPKDDTQLCVYTWQDTTIVLKNGLGLVVKEAIADVKRKLGRV